MRLTTAIICLVFSLSAANASQILIAKFYESSMGQLAEISESMFAGEGEGSSLEEKIIVGEGLANVIEIRRYAQDMIKKMGPDDSLIEILQFTNRILKENNRLMGEVANLYYVVRQDCRMGDQKGEEVPGACDRRDVLGGILKNLGNCWDNGEQIWVACKTAG